MTDYSAVVGSGNPVKAAATEAAFERAGVSATVTAVSVPSGVSEQPYGTAETVGGAENRARAAYEHDAAVDFGVGLEGGVTRLDGVDGLWLTMWAAVTDGERVTQGCGPRMRLPDAIAARVDAGEELGPVMDDVLDTSGVAKNQGAAGVLTAGVVDRQSALRAALAGALGPHVTDYYD